MRCFTLRTFLPTAGENFTWSGELVLMDEIRIPALTAQEGKSRLSELIVSGSLPCARFYHVEGSGDFPEVRPSFRFDVSFYLFEGGRICPVRIWRRAEEFAANATKSTWTVDFNGIPGWSMVAAIEPRWHTLHDPIEGNNWQVQRNNWTGASQRDWWERKCWSVVEPLRSKELPFTPAAATLG